MLKCGMSGEDRVVGLDDGAGELRGRVHAELKLGLLAIVSRQLLHQQSTETRASSTTKRVEHEEALETTALVG